LALNSCKAKSERAMRLYLASLIGTGAKVAVTVGENQFDVAEVKAAGYAVVFLDEDKLVCINFIQSAKVVEG
jgi:hypothetical protein